MKRFLLGLSVLPWVPLVAIACSSSSSSSNPAGTGADGGEGGALADGGPGTQDGGGEESTFPGDPPSGSSAPIEVIINGQPRTFDGQSTWTKFPSEAGTVIGFQTNAKSTNNWVFVLAVFGNETGKTYTCSGGLGAGGGVSLHKYLPDGGFDPNRISYGGSLTTEECSLTLDTYSPSQGEHVTGTFTAELDLSSGDSQVTHLSLTDGKFDLVNYSDVPP